MQAAKRELGAAVDHDKPRGEVGRVCRLSRQIDQGVNRMFAIIQADPGRCGRSPAVVRGLSDAVRTKALTSVGNFMAAAAGLEPATFAFEARRSIQLSYVAVATALAGGP